jgi:hypothetical protein
LEIGIWSFSGVWILVFQNPSSRHIDTLAELRNHHCMKALILLVCWCILFVLCWPVALLVLVLLPILWLLVLPFRLVGVVFGALFAFVQALLFLPARLLGWRKSECRRAH